MIHLFFFKVNILWTVVFVSLATPSFSVSFGMRKDVINCFLPRDSFAFNSSIRTTKLLILEVFCCCFFLQQVRNFLESTLVDLRHLWMKRIGYQLCVACPCERVCEEHKVEACRKDTCLHLLHMDECLANKVSVQKWEKPYSDQLQAFKEGPFCNFNRGDLIFCIQLFQQLHFANIYVYFFFFLQLLEKLHIYSQAKNITAFFPPIKHE